MPRSPDTAWAAGLIWRWLVIGGSRAPQYLGIAVRRWGLITGWGGTQRLPRLIGKGRALDMFVAAEKLAAAQALGIGLIDAIADDPVAEAGRSDSGFALNAAISNCAALRGSTSLVYRNQSASSTPMADRNETLPVNTSQPATC